MITRNSSYSELASIKAMCEEETFWWLNMASALKARYEQPGNFNDMVMYRKFESHARKHYRKAEFAHMLMRNYWNS